MAHIRMSQLSRVVVSLALATLLGQAAGKEINDTGVDQCLVGPVKWSKDCAGTGQDAEFGRDATKPNAKDGTAGFRFAKVCNNGDIAGHGSCPANPPLGEGATDWACTLDRVSSILWEVKTADGPRANSRYFTNLLPGDSGYGGPDDATGYVRNQRQQSLCGRTNWRLPTREQMQSLLNYSDQPFMMDPKFFPNPSLELWTSSSFAPNAIQEAWAWQTFGIPGQTLIYSRGVRVQTQLASLPAAMPTSSRYELLNGGTEVRDHRSGLVWRRCSEGQLLVGGACTGDALSLSWQDALTRAKSEAARTGVAWRLPNVKELASIFDTTRTAPAQDAYYFPSGDQEAYWSSTPTASQSQAGSAWAISVLNSVVLGEGHVWPHGVRIVRDDR